MFFGPEHFSDEIGRLEQAPIFRQAKGVLFGLYADEPNESVLQRMERLGRRHGIPVAYCEDFGHGKNNAIFPLGATAELDTSSGAVAATLAAVAQLDVRTASGKTQLSLPRDGAEIAYTAGSGRLRTEQPFDRKGDLYVFGGGEARITVASGSGNLEVR